MRPKVQRVRVAELAANIPNAIAAGPFGSNLVSRDYVEAGVPVIRGQNLSSRWVSGEFAYVSEAKAVQLKSNTARPGDIVFTQRGTLGQVSVVPARPFGTYVISQSQMKLTVDPSKADPRYIFYACTAPDFVAQVHNNAVAAGVPHINLGILRSLEVPLPEMAQQVIAADILASIDDRIDLLRQSNTTLESIAQALFKSWFIDFDPVKAKAEGREPEGMDAETAALFPSELEESALGPIPKGWRIGTLVDAFEINPYRQLAKGTDARYLEMANAPVSGHRPRQDVELRALGSGCKFINGDALLAKITPCLENGKSAFVDFLAEGEVGWGSTEFIVLRSRQILPSYAAYLMVRHPPFRQFAIQAMTGTSGRQRVDLGRLNQYAITLPPDSTIAQAASTILEMLQTRIAGNDQQVQLLASLRDTLLPRLISGKLRLPEAQEEIAAI